ncbi:MAG: adenylyltransferase/cytidyltransferase family protein [bacterium]|nr:adenylyltransferase/cytidyltransferase family protein [bacterium]
MKKKLKIVAVSGGYDPVHIGHIREFKAAKKLGDRLYAILNSDGFLKRKKGFVFMPFKERKEVLESIKYIDKVIPCIDKDQSVCKTLAKLKPDIFSKGGDKTLGNIPEAKVCKKYNIKMVFGVGGGKVQSSSALTKKLKK